MVLIFTIISCQRTEIIDSQQSQSQTLIATALPDNEELGSNDDEILRYDINKTDGAFIFITIPGIINKDLKISDLVEEYLLPQTDNTYVMKLFTLTDEYELKLTVQENVNIFDYLNYDTMSLDIYNITTNESIHNPTDSEELVDFWVDDYQSQQEQWKKDNYNPRFVGNFVVALDAHRSGAAITFNIPDEIAGQIVSELKNVEEKIVISEYRGTEKEFINMGIEVFLEDMGYEFSVLMWVNKEGTKAIGFGGELIPVSEKAYDLIIEVLKENMEWEEGWLPDMSNIITIELIRGDSSLGIICDIEDTNEISSILTNSKCMVGGSMCPFDAQLIFTYSDGKETTIKLATDGCPAIVVGTSTYYDFGESNAELGKGSEVKSILLSYFSIDGFDN